MLDFFLYRIYSPGELPQHPMRRIELADRGRLCRELV